MPETTHPPIANGTLVKTTQPNMALRSQWTDGGWKEKKWGVYGEVFNHSDSHGLCYAVQHEDESTGWYDPFELVLATKMHLPFKEVNLGEMFTSVNSKRLFGAVKIAPTEHSSAGTLQALDGPTYVGNAVILTDHVGKLAHDAGAITKVGDEEVVEVRRP